MPRMRPTKHSTRPKNSYRADYPEARCRRVVAYMSPTSPRRWLLTWAPSRVVGAEPVANPAAEHVPANNTGHVWDRDENAKTAVQQSNNEGDLKITQRIRRMLVDDKSLSTAYDVKIVTVDGVVTLRGPVVSEEERNTIANKATQVAGVRKVENQLEVGP
jgi:hyperosmotically inducible periplasmic protein